MNHYLCRARRIDNGEWVTGFYMPFIWDTEYWMARKQHTIFPEYDETGFDIDNEPREIDPQTIQKCTGWKDKNGNLLFEGQYFEDKWYEYLYKAVWDSERASFLLLRWKYNDENIREFQYDDDQFYEFDWSKIEVFDEVKFSPDGSWERVG